MGGELRGALRVGGGVGQGWCCAMRGWDSKLEVSAGTPQSKQTGIYKVKDGCAAGRPLAAVHFGDVNLWAPRRSRKLGGGGELAMGR